MATVEFWKVAAEGAADVAAADEVAAAALVLPGAVPVADPAADPLVDVTCTKLVMVVVKSPLVNAAVIGYEVVNVVAAGCAVTVTVTVFATHPVSTSVSTGSTSVVPSLVMVVNFVTVEVVVSSTVESDAPATDALAAGEPPVVMVTVSVAVGTVTGTPPEVNVWYRVTVEVMVELLFEVSATEGV